MSHSARCLTVAVLLSAVLVFPAWGQVADTSPYRAYGVQRLRVQPLDLDEIDAVLRRASSSMQPTAQSGSTQGALSGSGALALPSVLPPASPLAPASTLSAAPSAAEAPLLSAPSRLSLPEPVPVGNVTFVPNFNMGDPRPALSLSPPALTAISLDPGLGQVDLNTLLWRYKDGVAAPPGVGKVSGGGDNIHYTVATPALAADAPLSSFTLDAAMTTANTATFSSTATKTYDLSKGLILHTDQTLAVSQTSTGMGNTPAAVTVDQALGFDIPSIETTTTFGVTRDVRSNVWTGRVSSEKKLFGPFVLDAEIQHQSVGITSGTLKAGVNVDW